MASTKIVIPIQDMNNISVYKKTVSFEDVYLPRATLRYRVVSRDGTSSSEWSAVYDLGFLDPVVGSLLPINMAQANGFAPATPNRTTLYGAWSYDNTPMLQSGIEKILAQADAGATPEADLFKYSWIIPPSLNVKNFDIYLAWRSVVHVHPTATIGTLSGSGPYTATLTFTGTGAALAAQSVRKFYQAMLAEGESTVLYASPLVGIPGTEMAVVNGTATNTENGAALNIQIANASTAGTVRNVSRLDTFRNFQYAGASATSSFTFQRATSSNTMSAALTAGDDFVKIDEKYPILESGIARGMRVKKISGNGQFAQVAIVGVIDYENNGFYLVSDLNTGTAANNVLGGDIVFVAENTSVTVTAGTGVTTDIEWSMPYSVCAMLRAASPRKDLIYPYSEGTLLSISDVLHSQYGIYGSVVSSTTAAPFTASVTGLSRPLIKAKSDYGKKLFSTPQSGSFGEGSATYAKYNTRVSINIHSTVATDNGLITDLRF